MGIFDSIKNAVFGSAAAAAEPEPDPAPAAEAATPAPAAAKPAPAASASSPADAATAPAAKAPAVVDVAAVLDAAVAAKGQQLDWRHSIVDLMKALDLDSSLGARKELAAELAFAGDTSDSASMNIWLHKQLMKKLADNGGKVPAELTD